MDVWIDIDDATSQKTAVTKSVMRAILDAFSIATARYVSESNTMPFVTRAMISALPFMIITLENQVAAAVVEEALVAVDLEAVEAVAHREAVVEVVAHQDQAE